MSDQPEALRLADVLECASNNWHSVNHQAGAELRRLHVANAELTECLEKKSIAIQRIWKERDELRAEVERLRSDAADFHMAYRMKCDEETKAKAVDVERLRGVLTAIVDFVDGPAENKRPDVFGLRINAARTALKGVK
jgi:hypothetical protein